MKSGCIHLSQDLATLLPTTISATVHLKIVAPSMLSVWFHIFSNSSSSSQPHHVVTCVRLVSNFCYTCPCVKFTDTTPPPESSSTFMSSIFIACFVDHVMITCYLHLHKAQTKPSST